MNYQYRHGTTTMTALRTLYKEGGVLRFYRGLAPALVQGPMSRFGDTAANTGMLALLDHYDVTRNLPVAAKTAAASTAAAAFRVVLMPVDTLKTTLQVEGAKGLAVLGAKMRASGPQIMFYGSLGSFAATWVGHWPWFFVYNSLNEMIPKVRSGNKNGGGPLVHTAVLNCATIASLIGSMTLKLRDSREVRASVL